MTSQTVSLGSGVGGFGRGVRAVFVGLRRLAGESKMRRLALIPMVITLVAYVAMLVSLWIYTDDIVGLAWARPDDGWLIYVWYALVPVVFIAFTLVLLLLFMTIANLVAGPFWEEMAIHVLKGRGVDTQDTGFVKPTIYELARGLCFAIPAGICTLIGFIPVVGLPFGIAGTAIAWLGWASWALNPSLIATGHSWRQQVGSVFRDPMVFAGTGVVVGLSLFVPLLGLVSLPSAMIGLSELYADAT